MVKRLLAFLYCHGERWSCYCVFTPTLILWFSWPKCQNIMILFYNILCGCVHLILSRIFLCSIIIIIIIRIISILWSSMMSLYIHIEWIWKVPLFNPLITHGNGNFLNWKFIVECVLWITSLFICNWQWYHSLRWLLLLVINIYWSVEVQGMGLCFYIHV